MNPFGIGNTLENPNSSLAASSPNRFEDVDVDVIILSWNRTEETISAIDSALAQQGVTKRIWVIDQGSLAENLVRLRRFVADRPEVHLEALGRNYGVAEGRNIASRLGQAPYIVGLDNDAVFADPHVLARVVERFAADPRLGAAAFRIINYYTGRDDDWDYPLIYRDDPPKEFEATRFIGAGHALRRAAFVAAGEYDPKLFFFGEERDLSYRLLAAGYRIKFFRDFRVLHKEAREHRVRWKGERYYYCVRNTLFINYKFEMRLMRLLLAAAAFLVRGSRNGVPAQAIRGIAAATVLALRHRPGSHGPLYRLPPDVQRYISETERPSDQSVWWRIRKQFSTLG